MAIEFKKSAVAGHFPEIWRGECKILPGGFKPKNTIPVGNVVHRGTLLEVNFEEMSAAVIKVATVLKGGTTQKPRIGKGHHFAIGDVVAKVDGDGKKSPIITAIDTSNTEYDTLTLQAAITGLSEGDAIIEATEYAAAEGETTETLAKPKYTPNMIVGAVFENTGKGLPAISAAYEAVVLYPSLTFPILNDWLTGCCLKSNPNILFIKQ